MDKVDLMRFIKFFGFGGLISFLTIVMLFFVLAYTKVMDITVMLLLGIVWVLVGVIPSFLTATWLMIGQKNTANYMQLFIIHFVLATIVVLSFIVLTDNGTIVESNELLRVSFIIVVMGCVSGLLAMASGFLTFKKAKP